MMTASQQLLTEYVTSGCEEAFRELVRRYVDLVYSTAVRLVDGDRYLAQDVAQTVFVDLSRSAKSLSKEVRLGGWLHRHTCFVALKLMRTERRRRYREAQAAEIKALHEGPDSTAADLWPLLDQAIDRLGAEDRSAIILRFFERLDFRSIGKALGSSEPAAQKRVGRALEKLQVLLKRRGCTASVTVLATFLASNAVSAAPAGLAVALSASALAATGGATWTTFSFLKLLAAMNSKMAVTSLILCASLITPLILQQQRHFQLRRQLQGLRQQAARLSEAQKENQRLTALLAKRQASPALSKEQFSELLRLRGEVGRLRGQARGLGRSQAEQASSNPDLLSELEKQWSARASQLRDWGNEHPAGKIPELELLSENDWMNAVYPLTLENEDEYDRAMSVARANAELQVLKVFAGALGEYAKSNNGRFPALLTELIPFSNQPLPDDMLRRYEIVAATNLVPDLQGTGDWVITQKAPADEALDTRFALGLQGLKIADSRITNRWAFVP